MCGFRIILHGNWTSVCEKRTSLFEIRSQVSTKMAHHSLEWVQKCPDFGQRAFLERDRDLLC